MANAFLTPVVASPARVPVQYGLFSVLDFREPLDSHWEGAGVTWLSFDGGDSLGVVGRVQNPQSDTSGITKSFVSSTDTDTAGVFTVYGTQKVTPGAGWNQEKASERALAILLALEERTVEAVLSGEIAGLSPSFTTSPAAIGSTSDLREAVAEAEGWLGTHYGSRGVLHLSRANAVLGIARKVLETRGNGLYTTLGTPVAAGSGYPDDTLFTTSALLAYRSQVFPDVRVPYDLLDKGTNNLYAIAERTYSVGFEAAALGAVTITDSPA
jgi:hypothetical protein